MIKKSKKKKISQIKEYKTLWSIFGYLGSDKTDTQAIRRCKKG